MEAQSFKKYVKGHEEIEFFSNDFQEHRYSWPSSQQRTSSAHLAIALSIDNQGGPFFPIQPARSERTSFQPPPTGFGDHHKLTYFYYAESVFPD
jgi:hypothetical protein